MAIEGLVLLLVEEGRELRDEVEDVVGRRPLRVAEPTLQLQAGRQVDADLPEGRQGVGGVHALQVLVEAAGRNPDVEDGREVVIVVVEVAAQDPGHRLVVRRDDVELLGPEGLVHALVDDVVRRRQIGPVDVAGPGGLASLVAADGPELEAAWRGVLDLQD